jgi:hypothetical protein
MGVSPLRKLKKSFAVLLVNAFFSPYHISPDYRVCQLSIVRLRCETGEVARSDWAHRAGWWLAK